MIVSISIGSILSMSIHASTIDKLLSQYGELQSVDSSSTTYDTTEPDSSQQTSTKNTFSKDEYKDVYSDKDKESVQFTCNNDDKYPSFIDTGIKTETITRDEMAGILSQIVNSEQTNQQLNSDQDSLILVDGRLVKIEKKDSYTLTELNSQFSQTNVKFEFMQSKQNNQFVLSDYLQSNQDFKLIILGKEISLERKPLIENNRVLFPLREISEGLNMSVDWDKDTGIITIEKDNKRLILKENSRTLTVFENDKSKEINIQAIPRIVDVNGEARIFGYVDDIITELGYEIYWDATKLAVIIYK